MHLRKKKKWTLSAKHLRQVCWSAALRYRIASESHETCRIDCTNQSTMVNCQSYCVWGTEIAVHRPRDVNPITSLRVIRRKHLTCTGDVRKDLTDVTSSLGLAEKARIGPSWILLIHFVHRHYHVFIGLVNAGRFCIAQGFSFSRRPTWLG